MLQRPTRKEYIFYKTFKIKAPYLGPSVRTAGGIHTNDFVEKWEELTDEQFLKISEVANVNINISEITREDKDFFLHCVTEKYKRDEEMSKKIRQIFE